MEKILSNREKTRRKLLKIYKSIENKLQGKNKIWWDSLSMKARYAVVFKWISAKKTHYLLHKEKLKFKHFIKDIRPKFKNKTDLLRNVIIDYVMDENKN